MSLTTRVLVALVAGFVLGALAIATHSQPLLLLATAARPIGALWVNAILMTVVPLVVASLVVSVSSLSDSAVLTTLSWRAIVLLALLLGGGACYAAVLAPSLVAWLPIDPAAGQTLRASFASAATTAPPPTPALGQWISALAPANAVRAAADGAMLPLVVFSVAFALALGRLEDSLRIHAVRFFDAIAKAMVVILGWVIAVAPIGVFALSLALGTQLGAASASAIAYYVVLSAALCVSATLLLYALAVIGGRIPLSVFARAAAGAQTVAASTRSSLASLPAMLRAANTLRLRPIAGDVFLPFAVSTFKFTSPLAYITAACFVGRLFGTPLDTARLMALVPLAIALSLGVPGVPGGWFTATPIFLAAGLPAEAIGVLIAVDAVPDIFRTVGNVTADLVAATVVGRFVAPESPETGPLVPSYTGALGGTVVSSLAEQTVRRRVFQHRRSSASPSSSHPVLCP